MERIKKALELARRQRGQNGTEGAASISNTPLPARINGATAPTRIASLAPEHLERHRVLHSGSHAAVRRAYKMLRTQLLQRMRDNALQTIGVLSPATGDGKSLTAANLAISVAQDPNHTALLVDLDLRRPTLHQLFGVTVEQGVDDYLRGRCAVAQALSRFTQYERLALLPARAAVEDSSELLASARARELIAELKGRYPDRIVIIDLPPVLACDDALTLTPSVDCVLVVTAEGFTRREELVRALRVLDKARIVATVLNRCSEPATGLY
jgi:capsular exopolysaccharide synthesis family protein